MQKVETNYSEDIFCFDKEDIERLDEASFLEILIGHRNSFHRIYRLKLEKVNYYLKVRNIESIKTGYCQPFEWVGPNIKRNYGSYQKVFEEIFDKVPEEIKAEMVFYFDILLKT